MPFIRVLDLSHNRLTGSLTNLPSGDRFKRLRTDKGGILLLQDNLFQGSVRRSLCTKIDLEVLDLSRNRLTGKIPKCLGNLENLSMLLLGSNRLSGVIPSSLGRISSLSLRWLHLNDNNLSGELPQAFRNLGSLYVLNLGENKISGNIPEWIGENLTELEVLRLHKNNFTNRIPQSLCKLSDIQILDLAHNSLTGSIPHCFEELHGMVELPWYTTTYLSMYYDGNVMQAIKGAALEYSKMWILVTNLDLSSNKLVGEIRQELTALSGLLGLNLSHNHLSGVIPKGIGNMTSIFSLDLSANELTGTIPPSISALNFLNHLNMSHNNLSGRIPTGNQLQTLTDPSIYAANKDLCGAPLPKNCYNHEDTMTDTSKKKHEDANEPKKVWFYLITVCGFATGFCDFIGVLLFKKQWRQKLFMFTEATMDRIYVAVAATVSQMKRGREAF